MFAISFVIGLALLFKVIAKIRKKESVSSTEITYMFFCGMIFALGFGSSTSGGLSMGQSALNFGFIAAIVLYGIGRLSEKKLKVALRTTATALILLFLVASVSVKVVTPYYWWGLTAESYPNANSETSISYFKGIRLTADEKFVYEDFVEKADMYLSDGDELYCYSQIGVFYVLADKVPKVKAPIPWFDVSRSETILEDLEYLKHNEPMMIVFADYGYDTLKVHEELFNDGNESGHRKMYEWMLECRDSGTDYTVIETYSLHNYQIYLMLRI
jgi:hypothetical protein